MNAYMLVKKLRALCKREYGQVETPGGMSVGSGIRKAGSIYVTHIERDEKTGGWEFELNVLLSDGNGPGRGRYAGAIVTVMPDLTIGIDADNEFPRELLACALKSAEV
jgi:hypothetical protein